MSRAGHLTVALSIGLSLASCGSDDATKAPTPTIPPTCNGHVELCDRTLDQVVFPATHNAMSNADENWIAPNQTHPIGRQLDDGIRAFLIDTHTFEGEPHLCHSVCQFGAVKLVDALSIYKKFLDAHRGEVVALIIEDDVSAADTERAMVDSGLVKYVFTQPNDGPYPTLRELIAKDTRLLVTAENGRPPPAWYHHVWDLAWDTPYSYDSVQRFDEIGCDVNRGRADHALFLVNHWIGNPLSSLENATIANTYEVLSAHVNACKARHGRKPTFVAVDFYEQGSLFRVVDELNGVAAR